MPQYAVAAFLAAQCGLVLAARADSSLVNPTPVDTRTVLEIGPLQVSAYNIEKNFRRAFGEAPNSASADSANGVQHWFAQFLAKQVLMAEAMKGGYLERPDILAETAAMADYILASPDGPYYRVIAEPATPTPRDLDQVRACLARHLDVVIAVFENEQSRATLAGPDFERLSYPQRLSRLASLKYADGVILYSGPICWPFEPFEAFATRLQAMSTGQWLLNEVSSSGTMIAYCRGFSPAGATQQQLPDDRLRPMVYARRRYALMRRHQSDTLADSELRIDPLATRLLCQSMLDHPTNDATIDPGPVASKRDIPLFSFRGPNGLETVRLGEFVTNYNRQPIKTYGDAYEVINAAIKGSVVADWDISNARAIGLDRTDKFTEDRLNFLRFQALAQFERDNLGPLVHIGDAEVAAEFQSEAKGKAAPRRCAVLTADFRTRREALNFASTLRGQPLDQPVWHATETDARSADHWGGRPARMLLGMREDSVLGVFHTDSGFRLVARGRTLELSAPQLRDAAPRIRADLEKLALERLEIGRARDDSGQFEIADHIDYQSYGVTPALSPWHR